MRRFVAFLTVYLIASGVLATTGSEPSASRPAETKSPRLVEQSRFSIPAVKVAGIRIQELSGLAWDEDEQLLYAVSDKGKVFHFRLKLDGSTIVAIEPVYAALLADAGRRARRGSLDAEGLSVLNADNGKPGDTELLVVAEGAEPRVIRFSPAGAMLGEIPVPPPLDDRRNYRGTNKRLESVAHHARYGLMTAPESPLEGRPKNLHTVYAGGRHWSFEAHPAKDSRLKGIEVLPDGNLLVLERSFTGSTKPLVVSLRYVNLAACSVDGACAAEDLAVFSRGRENFEGLTHIGDHRFLIVSDHGKEDIQGTTFMLFTLQ